MESPPMHLIPSQLDYSRKDFAGSKLKYSRIVPLSGSQQVNIPISSTAEVLLEIPTQVFNWSESYLYFDLALPPQAAGNYTWYYTLGAPWISEIDLYTRSGIYLCQLSQFQNYMNTVRPIETNREEYMSSDSTSYLFPSNAANGTPPAVTPSQGNSALNYIEPAYVNNNGQAAAQTDLTVSLPLRSIKNTIFALNKLVVFPDILVMRILFGPGTKIFFGGTSDMNPKTAPTVGIAGNVGAPAPTVNNIGAVAYNLTLYMARETNEDLAQSVRSLVNSPQGMNLLLDYVYPFKQNLSGASQSLSYRLNRGHGKNLVKIITAPYNNTEQSNTAYEHIGIGNASTSVQTSTGANIASYYTVLDNIRLQDIQVNIDNSKLDDYRENRKFLRDSAIASNLVYQNNWFHEDKFYEENPIKLCDDTNLDRALSLVVERKYDAFFTMTGTPTINWYSFVCVQKYLHIGAQFVQFQ